MTYPAMVFLALLLWSFTWRKENLVYLLFGSAAFGSLAVLPPGLVAGANLLPGSLSALVMAGRYIADAEFRATLFRNALSPTRLGLYTAFMVVAAISALFYPRLFAGQVEVAAMRASSVGATDLLGPTAANFTQLAYLCVSYAVALAVYSRGHDRAFAEKVLGAMLLGDAILVLSGLADLALGGSGASPLLAVFKTADYTMIEGAEVFGVRRLTGFMSEPAAFGGACVAYGAATLFAAAAIEDQRKKVLANVVALASLALGAMATSSTAYVGLAAVAAFFAANMLRRGVMAFLPGKTQALRFVILGELTVLYTALAAIALCFVFLPEIFATPSALIEEMIFRKSLGGSFYERMKWNELALEGLRSTLGLGVGVGGARTSNWFVAVLSNTGILGAIFLFGFVGMAALRPARASTLFDREVAVAWRATIGVSLVMLALAATSPDPGVFVAALLALAAAQATPYTRASRIRRTRQSKLLSESARVQGLKSAIKGWRRPLLSRLKPERTNNTTVKRPASPARTKPQLRRWAAMRARHRSRRPLDRS